jgi:SOS response regulatory protein OraA/RecX
MSTADDARERVLHWLKHGELSASAIRDRLIAAGHDPDDSDTLIARLVANGTIDDARCAESLVHRWTHAGPIAATELQRRLEAKGIPSDIAHRASASNGNGDVFAQALESAERKLKSLGGQPPPVVARRLFGHLARRGFDEDTARSVLDHLGLLPAGE